MKPYEKMIGATKIRVIGHREAHYPGEPLSQREIVERLTPISWKKPK